MRLRLQKLQAEDEQARKTRARHSEGWNNINRTFHYQSLLYIPEIIRTELISRHHDNLLASHFCIKKTLEIVAQKYYWPSLCHIVEDYVKRYNVYLASKTVYHKPYEDSQSLPIPTHR